MNSNQDVKCKLCGGFSELKHQEFIGYQEGMTFEIYFCKDCQTSFSMPRVDSDKLYEAIYKNGECVPGYDRYWRYFKTIKKKANPLKYLTDIEASYWGILEALNQVVKNKQSTKILEIGSGLGYLTYSLRNEHFDVCGLDISQEAVNQANENFGNYYICQDLFDYAKRNTESFDIVILSEVIEHIDNPISFIDTILKLLKPNGRVILTTPNKSFFPSEIIWDTDLPPIHCWWFSEDSMKYIAKKLNLDAFFVNFSKFYKKNYELHDMRKNRNSNLHGPILGKNLELKTKSKQPKKLKALYKSFIFLIPFVKTIYIKLKCISNSNYVLCTSKGMHLCVIFKKSNF
jgi:SAM-dependent methyltransferase